MIAIDKRLPERTYANDVVWKRNAPPDWKPIGFCVDVRLQEDTDCGGFVIYAANLPGVMSQGEDITSSLRNILEALTLALETYASEKMEIPWATPEEARAGEIQFRIAVHV